MFVPSVCHCSCCCLLCPPKSLNAYTHVLPVRPGAAAVHACPTLVHTRRCGGAARPWWRSVCLKSAAGMFVCLSVCVCSSAATHALSRPSLFECGHFYFFAGVPRSGCSESPARRVHTASVLKRASGSDSGETFCVGLLSNSMRLPLLSFFSLSFALCTPFLYCIFPSHSTGRSGVRAAAGTHPWRRRLRSGWARRWRGCCGGSAAGTGEGEVSDWGGVFEWRRSHG